MVHSGQSIIDRAWARPFGPKISDLDFRMLKKELKSKKKFEKFIPNRISSYQTSKDKRCLSY